MACANLLILRAICSSCTVVEQPPCLNSMMFVQSFASEPLGRNPDSKLFGSIICGAENVSRVH